MKKDTYPDIRIEVHSEGLAKKILGKVEDSPPSVYGEEKPTSTTIPDINAKGVNREMAEILETSNKKPNYTAIVKEAIQELRKETTGSRQSFGDLTTGQMDRKTGTRPGTSFTRMTESGIDEYGSPDQFQVTPPKDADAGVQSTASKRRGIESQVASQTQNMLKAEGDDPTAAGSSSWDTRKTGKGKYSGLTGPEGGATGQSGRLAAYGKETPTSPVFGSKRKAGYGASAIEGGPTETGTRASGTKSEVSPLFKPSSTTSQSTSSRRKDPAVFQSDRPDFDMAAGSGARVGDTKITPLESIPKETGTSKASAKKMDFGYRTENAIVKEVVSEFIQKQAPMMGGAAGQLPKTTSMTKPANMGVGQQQPVVSGAGVLKAKMNKEPAPAAKSKTSNRPRKNIEEAIVKAVEQALEKAPKRGRNLPSKARQFSQTEGDMGRGALTNIPEERKTTRRDIGSRLGPRRKVTEQTPMTSADISDLAVGFRNPRG
jgi:hypothetical protein